MYFVAATLEVHLRTAKTLTIADSRFAHAAILRAISDSDRLAGQVLHNMERHKHFTSAIIDSRGQLARLRVTFMAQEGLDYATTLINALARCPSLRLGCIHGEVCGIDVSSHDWSGVSTWADLITGTTSSTMRFTFHTPTAITKDDEWGGRFTALYPDPTDVFSGLARRWHALHGPALPDDLALFVRAGGCVVANYQLQTTMFRTLERTQIGFVGHVVFHCRKQDQLYIAALNALTRLAFYTGVGYQTTRGMGVTRTTIA